MSFDEIPENNHNWYPCDCGGDIQLSEDGTFWICNSCDFKKPSGIDIEVSDE